MSEAPPLAVYVHWPYCARICPYCDFNVIRDRGQGEQASLARAIAVDLEAQAGLIGERRLTSIFLGGGTPSLMDPAWAAEIIEAARRLWPTDEAVEITLEANPTDAEASRFQAFREAGVDRLSLGVQAFDDAALKFLGRNHSAAEARRAAETAISVFPRVSLDLIYALPGQTREAWAAELEAAVALGVEHISPYQLTIEPGTAFDRAVGRKVFTPLDPDAAADLYETTQEALTAAGFEAYEVSNHAKGRAARSAHNLAYWRGWDYVGAGPGAHGRLTAAGRLATYAEPGVSAYISAVAAKGTGFKFADALDPREAAIERLLLGLRTLEGVRMDEVAALEMKPETLSDMAGAGFLNLGKGRLTTTAAGRAVLNSLLAKLVP